MGARRPGLRTALAAPHVYLPAPSTPGAKLDTDHPAHDMALHDRLGQLYAAYVRDAKAPLGWRLVDIPPCDGDACKGLSP